MLNINSMPEIINIISPCERFKRPLPTHNAKKTKAKHENLVYINQGTYMRPETDEKAFSSKCHTTLNKVVSLLHCTADKRDIVTDDKIPHIIKLNDVTYDEEQSTLTKISQNFGKQRVYDCKSTVNIAIANAMTETGHICKFYMIESFNPRCEFIHYIEKICRNKNSVDRFNTLLFICLLNSGNKQCFKFSDATWAITSREMYKRIDVTCAKLENMKEFYALREYSRSLSIRLEASFLATYCGLLQGAHEHSNNYKYCYLNNKPTDDISVINMQMFEIACDGSLILDNIGQFDDIFITKSHCINLYENEIPVMVTYLDEVHALLIGGEDSSHVIGSACGEYESVNTITLRKFVKGKPACDILIKQVLLNAEKFKGCHITTLSHDELVVLAAYSTMPYYATNLISDWRDLKIIPYSFKESFIIDYDQIKLYGTPHDFEKLDRETMYLLVYLPFYLKYGYLRSYLDIPMLSNEILKMFIMNMTMTGEYLIPSKETKQIVRTLSVQIFNYERQVRYMFEQLRAFKFYELLLAIDKAKNEGRLRGFKQDFNQWYSDNLKCNMLTGNLQLIPLFNNFKWNTYHRKKLSELMTIEGFNNTIMDIKGLARYFRKDRACYTDLSEVIALKPPFKQLLLNLINSGIMCVTDHTGRYGLKWFRGKTGRIVRNCCKEHDVYIEINSSRNWHAIGKWRDNNEYIIAKLQPEHYTMCVGYNTKIDNL